MADSADESEEDYDAGELEPTRSLDADTLAQAFKHVSITGSSAALIALDLSGLGLTALPGIGLCMHVRSLDLARNALDTDSLGEVAALTGLLALDVSENEIGSLDTVLSHLRALQRLRADSNKLAAAPATLASGVESCLFELVLSKNSIKTTEGLEGLLALRILKLAFNPLTSIAELAGLQQLKSLDLASTAFESFDALKPLKAMGALRSLNIAGTPAVEATEDFGHKLLLLVPKLEALDGEVLEWEAKESAQAWEAERLAAEREAAEAEALALKEAEEEAAATAAAEALAKAKAEVAALAEAAAAAAEVAAAEAADAEAAAAAAADEAAEQAEDEPAESEATAAEE
ncbi:hypothetical protein T492DRAFT_980767 [Pavlovales sp. CCMP2436]|nr:hypothetical protein T492DRAFT_980767 [Pavlovales sp. CCMP2436]